MADIVYMTKAAWQKILDAIRGKTGKTDALTSAQAADEIQNISAGSQMQIDDARGFFATGVRWEKASEYVQCFSEEAKTEKCSGLFYNADKISDLSPVKEVLQKVKFATIDSYSPDNPATTYRLKLQNYEYDANCMFYYATLPTLTEFPEGAFGQLVYGGNMFTYAALSITAFPEGAFKNLLYGNNMFNYFTLNHMVSFPDGAFSKLLRGNYMFANSGLTGVTSFPAGAFSQLTDAEGMFFSSTFRSLTSFPEGAFTQVQNARNMFYRAWLPKFTVFSPGAFEHLSKSFFRAFSNVSNVVILDFPSSFTLKGVTNTEELFLSCNSLVAVILRFDGVVRLTTAMKKYSKMYFYVPRTQIDNYKRATDWTLVTSNILPLEDYTVDGTTTGAFSPEKAGITL